MPRTFHTVPLALAALLVALLLALASCGEDDAGSASAAPPQANPRGSFDERRAWRLIELQLGYGQRPAGSPQLRRLAVKLRERMPNGRFERIPDEPKLRNIVSVVPGKLPALVVGAHYDTLREPKGFQGANNGAAGSAAVVELARELAKEDRPAGSHQVRFVLFDGEEPAKGLPEEQTDFYSSGLRGSRAYVDRHGGQVGAMILLDYIAGKNLSLPREGSSTPELWDEIRAGARRAGVARVFPSRIGPTITDDHTPFLRAGIPAVDLIDWSYPGHELSDTLDALSKDSLDATGETVHEAIEAVAAPSG
ncbi:MAG: M28 family peptidase [Solirubrobacterales bacterium]|nr:M28 family peptidase [Solirubrobacterales bacterium]MCB8969884.1 M28 family peptidase [Thermoleophilales bacterium]